MRAALFLALAVCALPHAAFAQAAPAPRGSATFNLDCIIAVASSYTAEEEITGVEADIPEATAIVLYFLGRFQGMSDEEAGEALAERAGQNVLVDGVFPLCLEEVAMAGDSLEIAAPAMDIVEARVRRSVGGK